MGVYKRGNRFWYKRMIDGRVYQRPLGLKIGQVALVQARARQVEDEIFALHYGLDRPAGSGSSVMFSEFRKRYLEAKKDKATIERDRQRLDYVSTLWPDLPLAFYTKAHVEALEDKLSAADALGREPRPATINRYMELLRAMFNLAIEDGVLKENPLRFYQAWREDGTRRALTDDELRRILAAAAELEKSKGFRLRHVFRDLILLALATGMRLGEILNLRREWINEDLVALPLASTKSRRRGNGAPKQRVKIVALNNVALEVIGRQRGKDGYVFDLHRRDAMVIQHGVEAIRRLAKIPDFTFHHLRHTASTIVASQSSLATARVVLGHADLRTTLRYTHPDLADQRTSVTILATKIRSLSPK